MKKHLILPPSYHLPKGGNIVSDRLSLTTGLSLTTLPPFLRSIKNKKEEVNNTERSRGKKVVRLIEDQKTLISLRQNGISAFERWY
jgi:hypothetical protein